MTENTKTPQPMDPNAREEAYGTPMANSKRVCGSLQTLVKEVAELFPETTVTYDQYDGRNTALSATFDYQNLNEVDAEMLSDLLSVLNVDPRVNNVHVKGDSGTVTINSNPRTQDNREVFGLSDALEAMGESTAHWQDDGEQAFSQVRGITDLALPPLMNDGSL